MILEDFKVFINKLSNTSSRTSKENILDEYRSNNDIKEIVRFIFNPYVVTGISKKKFYKKVTVENNVSLSSIKEIMNYLTINNHGSDQDIANIQKFVHDNFEYEDVIYNIVCKDLVVGITGLTINKVWGKGFIDQFDVMLAEKYFSDPEKYLPNGTEFILTEKLDGVRCVLIFDKDNEPHFFTRNGKEIFDLVDLAEEAHYLDPDYVYDGELLSTMTGHSKDVYRDTISIISSDNIKRHIIFNMFDMIKYEDFIQGYSNVPAISRKNTLHNICIENKEFLNYIYEVPILYTGKDKNYISTYLTWAETNGKEGVMINIANAPYECKRSRNLLKVKKFSSMDLRIVDVEEGTGRNEGRLGNIVCKYKDNCTVNVGSGFTDNDREVLWKNRESIIGKIAEICYFEETKNKNSGYSLRFPTFKSIRNDKDVADYE